MGAKKKPDFSGYVTKSGIECSDGRTILAGAFKHQDKATVPLVWQHNHDDPENVLGHVELEDRPDGTYGYGYFNTTQRAQSTKIIVEHGDISAMSIYANKLSETLKKVKHGVIREVSLVLAGANPGAFIENITLQHGDDLVTIDDEAKIFHEVESEEDGILYGDKVEDLEHAEDKKPEPKKSGASEDDPTAQEVYDSMSEEQQGLLHYMVGEASKKGATPEDKKAADKVEHGADADPNKDKETKHMSRNLFEAEREKAGGTIPSKALAHDGISERKMLSHDDLRTIAENAVKMKSMKAAVEDFAIEHGIDNIDILFPDARTITSQPDFDKRRTEWVASVINGTKKSPFSRVKTIIADITHDEARAKGYIKGTMKKEEFFGLVKRTTGPSTIYKKQKLDRDDIIDITDFDVVAWLKVEMRLMLDEEIARAVLIGDGRAPDDEDKIKDPAGSTDGLGIRSILHDDDLYAVKVNINTDDAGSDINEITDTILLETRFYKGSGSPTLYTTQVWLTKMLLARDEMGRRLYRTSSDLASEIGVSNIVTVEVMESEPNLIGIIVNLSDYTLGADKGGDVSMFDDFDIDYNQYKYLIETRLSGGLTKIRSALVLLKTAGTDTLVTPVSPTFVESTGVLTPATTANVTYKRADTNATVTTGSPITLSPGQSLKIYAVPTAGHYFDDSEDNDWTFKRPSA